MKKALMILLFCAMLTGCGNSDKKAATVTTAVSHETVTTTTAASVSETTELTTTEITAEITDATAGKISTSRTTKKTETTTSKATTKAKVTATRKSVTESTVSSQTEPERIIGTETPKTKAESRQTTSERQAVTKAPESTTVSAAEATTEKAKQKITTTTTAKPKETTTTTKSKDEQYAEEYWEIIDRKGLNGKDGTCLETMVLSLRYSDTPPSYYENIGKGLRHNGTDYGKAAAVYKWMLANGHGSCVYYAMETYFVCKGAGLECAYAFATNNNWYGHTYSVVKVNGIWYVLDTQGETFLDNCEVCTRMFDGNENDLKPFKEDIWYDYDENGEFRDWTISD